MKSFLFSFLSWWTWLLTLTSGFTNVCTLLLWGEASTHHTGNISKLSIALAEGGEQNWLLLFFPILAFFMGSVLSGILFHEQKLRPQKRYGILLIALGLLLSMVEYLFDGTPVLYTLSFLAGAQNGMFLYIGSYLARTTHLTGYLTDTAFALGRILRGYKEDRQKFVFNLSQILVFILGAGLAVLFPRSDERPLIFFISFLYIFAGVMYFVARRNHLLAKYFKKPVTSKK